MILSASATLLLAAGSLWAAPQEEGLTFSNSNPRVLSVLEAEGFLGGGGVEKAGGADVYIPAAGDQCAGVVEVDFRRGSGASARVAGVQVIASRSDGEAFVPQALSRSRGFSTREALVVSGGGDFRVEVSYFFAQDAFGQAVSATKIFSARVGCDTVVPLGVEVPDLGDGDGLRRLTRADARKVDHEQSIDSVMSRRYDLVGGGGVEGVAKAARIFGGETRVTPSATPAGETSPGEAAQGGAPLTPSSSSLGTGTQCSSDGFDGDTLGGEWSISFLGDADLGSATESGGTLQVSGNGSSFFHGDDNGIFVHRSVDGDFRIEATVTDFPAVPGDSFAKSGINARTGTGANDARVFVQVVPDHPTFDTTVIQFDYRDENGSAFELASQLTGVTLRVSLAIDRRGDLFRVYYSLDDGATWNVPAGAAGGEVEIPVGSSTMEVGFSTSSYDASPSLTAEFDDFSLCQPNMDPAPMPPPPVACIPGRPTNVIFLLDRSGSMTFPYPGADSKLDAARSAIYAMNDLLASNLPGSQAALIAFSGNRDPQFNLNSSAQVLSGLTTDLDAVNQAAAAIDVGAIDPISSTPLAIALEMTTQVLQAESGDGRLPLLVWLTDTVPNVDSLGFGPSAYRFEEVSQISLLDSAGVSFRPWGEVAWEGNYNAAIDTYDGQVLGDAMREILEMKAAVPDTTIFGVAIQSDEVFNEELMDFAATFTGGNVYSVAEADAILDAVADLVDLVDCGANIQGRVWFDMDAEGDQDAGEAGLETVTVELLDSSGSVVMTTETGPDGMYMFEGVLDGNYTVRVVDQTLPAAADRPTFDIDGIATPHLAQVSVVSEQDVVGVDFGYTVGTVIGGGPGCTDDSFDDGLLSPVWMLANVGDADQGAVAETGGSLELTTDGTSLFHGDDNGAFVYQMVEGDFRSEVRVDGFPVNVGGDYRKAGLAYRSGTQPDAARVMVMVVADYADTGAPAIQFDTRTSDGGVPVVLSSTIQNISLPVHLSIERRQDQITVSVSQDGGTTWRIPAGGLGGSEMISALGGPALIGLMGASYDADQTLTARFDDFQLCQPDDTEPPPPPPPTECVVGAPKDYVLLLDQSGSMAFEFPGMVSKFEAAKASLTQLIASIDALDNGSRVALITFSGERDDPAYNLNESVKVRSGLTTDLGGVITQLDSLSMRDIPWYGTTPLPLALDRLTQLLTDQRDPSRESIVYWISDQLPNIDSAGQGPREYPLDKLDDIPLRDGAGNFLPPGVVAFSGPYHGTTDTFCGEPLGNSMDSIVTLSQAHPDVRVFGVTLAGDGMGFGTFSFDLNQYAAFYTNGDALLASNAVDLTVDLLDLLQVVNCDEAGLAQIGDRVWNDSDGDGLQEAGETGIPGVRVYLLDLAGDLVATADTGADGDYLFIDVPPGTYTVEVAADSLPAGLRQTFDYDGLGTPNSSLVIVTQFQVMLEIDFGYEPGPVTPPPPVVGCIEDDFEGAQLGGSWKTALLGDATAGDASVAAGELQVTGNGTSYFTQDNGFFVYQEVNNVAFRVEVDVVGSSVVGESIYEKAGLAVANGLGSAAQRVTIQYQPSWPDSRGSLQFRYRDAVGGSGGLTWASSFVEPGLPVRIAIEKDGDTYTAEFSQDGGATWNRAAGGAQSVIDISMGDALVVGLTATSYTDEDTLTGVFDNFGLCAEEVQVEIDEFCVQLAPSSQYSSSGGHGVWLPGLATDLVFVDAGTFVEYSDGTALLTGQVFRAGDFSKGFDVEVRLAGRTDDPPAGSPKRELANSAYMPQGPVDPGTWYYYTQFSSTFTGLGDWEGAILDVTPRGEAWQMGVGANNKNLDFGASAWLHWVVQQQPTSGDPLKASGGGDFNLSLICPVEIAEECVSASESDQYHGASDLHAVWMPGIATDLVFATNGTLVEFDNGTATLTGRLQVDGDASKGFDLELRLFGKTDDPPAGSPRLELLGDAYFPTGPIDPSTWNYYTNYRATLVGLGDWLGAEIELSPEGSALQVGVGAGNKNANPGLSAWFRWDVISQPTSGGSLATSGRGDFNMDLVCPPDLASRFCVSEALGDQYSSSGNHAVAIPGIAKDLLFFPGEGGDFREFADGTARFVGRVHHKDDEEKILNFEVLLTGRTDVAPPGSPKKQLPGSAYAPAGPADPATWYYYSDFAVTFTGEGLWADAVIEATPTGPAWQIGIGASNKNVDFGASAWFSYRVVEQPSTGETLRASGSGDFNVNLGVDCPSDGGDDGGDGGGDDGDDAAFCPRDSSFWMNNTDAWPVDALELGGFVYSYNDLRYFLEYGGSDAATRLARSLVTVSLNLENGAEGEAELAQQIADAHLLLGDFPPGTNPQGGDRALADALRDDLDEQYELGCSDGLVQDDPSDSLPTDISIGGGGARGSSPPTDISVSTGGGQTSSGLGRGDS